MLADHEVCNPIAGSGLAFESRVDRSSTRWTLQGVRIGVPIPDCQKPILMTQVSKYQRWLSHELKSREPPLYIEKINIRPTATERPTTTTSRSVPTIIVAPVSPTTEKPRNTTPQRRTNEDPLTSGSSRPVQQDFQKHPVNALYISSSSSKRQQSDSNRKATKVVVNSTEMPSARPKNSPKVPDDDQKRTVTTKRPSQQRNTEPAPRTERTTTSRPTRRPEVSDDELVLSQATPKDNNTKRPAIDSSKLKYHSSRPLCPALPFSEVSFLKLAYHFS